MPKSPLMTTQRANQEKFRKIHPSSSAIALPGNKGQIRLIDGRQRLIVSFRNQKRAEQRVVCLDLFTGEEIWWAEIPQSHSVLTKDSMVAVAVKFNQWYLEVPVDPNLEGSSWTIDLKSGKVARLVEEPVEPWICLAGEGVIFGIKTAKGVDMMYAVPN